MKLKLYFNQQPHLDQVDVYVRGEDAHGRFFIAKPTQLEFEKVPEGTYCEPTLKFSGPMSREFFPALVNALAESGYKVESSDAGELKATKTHLEDMRSLVFERQKP